MADRFVSYLEVLQASGRLPARIQAVMTAYFGRDMSQEEAAEKFRVSERTIRGWIGQGLNQMGEIISGKWHPYNPPGPDHAEPTSLQD